MMHLKNIKAGNAKTLEQYELTKKHGVIWLYSEDGKNWYEEVKNFQPDTIKIVYDENNIIVIPGLIDKHSAVAFLVNYPAMLLQLQN